MKHFLLYFGCRGKAGHFLFDRQHGSIYDARALGLPFNGNDFDGSSIFLPHPERPGHGALTHVIRGEFAYTVLAWWGSPFDARPAVNAAIIASGWDEPDYIWSRFEACFPDLKGKLDRPEIVP